VVKLPNFLLGNGLLAYSKVPWWNIDKNTPCFFFSNLDFALYGSWDHPKSSPKSSKNGNDFIPDFLMTFDKNQPY
jgi:hypothetical protein